MKWLDAMRHWLADPPQPLPKHVRDVRLDEKLLLHMSDAQRGPSKRTQSGSAPSRG